MADNRRPPFQWPPAPVLRADNPGVLIRASAPITPFGPPVAHNPAAPHIPPAAPSPAFGPSPAVAQKRPSTLPPTTAPNTAPQVAVPGPAALPFFAAPAAEAASHEPVSPWA